MPDLARFANDAPQIAEWRRHLHRTPELGFDTHETAAFVAAKLREFGCDEVVEGIGRTGVVGVIKGRSDGPAIGLRADMDALPILEDTGAEWTSLTPGVMHACGHDGHTAMLLGAARALAEAREFAGTVAVIFQPAEEGGGGGREMVADGMMERFGITEVYGMHNWPGLPEGSFAIRPGPFFAATDTFDIEITGRGGHAAKPHETVDPVPIAAQVVTALQTIASRVIDPVGQVVVSVTAMETSSGAYNVIPSAVRMRGTVRTMDPAVQDTAEARIGAICEGIAAASGAVATVDYHRNYPVMVNHVDETDHAAAAATRVGGQCDVADLIMGGEDFAFMLEARPGAYILLGTGEGAPVHHPKYDFNDAVIPQGCAWWCEVVAGRLPL